LKQFIGENKWAHIDIAPRMDATGDDYLAHGSTGEPTRLLLEFIKNYK
jgi:leucyl aminopeptidase